MDFCSFAFLFIHYLGSWGMRIAFVAICTLVLTGCGLPDDHDKDEKTSNRDNYDAGDDELTSTVDKTRNPSHDTYYPTTRAPGGRTTSFKPSNKPVNSTSNMTAETDHVDLPLEKAPIVSGPRCSVDGSFHERLYVNGEGDIPEVIRVPKLKTSEIEKIPTNIVGRWVEQESIGWFPPKFHDKLAHQMDSLLSGGNPIDFQRFWYASRGPQFREYVERGGVYVGDTSARCGSLYRSQNSETKNCFTFMMLVTNIPVPKDMKPRHVAKALGLDKFCIDNQLGLVTELQRYRNDPSTLRVQYYGNRELRLAKMYADGFAANWLALCPNLIDAVTPDIRKMVFEHSLYRHRLTVVPQRSSPYRIEVVSRNSTLTEMLPMLLTSSPNRLLNRVDRVEFTDEDGVGRGVITNWYEEMGRQIIGEEFGIFEISDNKKYAQLKPKVLADARRDGREAEMKRRLRAAGRFLGHALANNRYFSTDLTTMFLAKLTGRIIGFEALNFYEHIAYTGYEMVYNDGASCGIDVPEFLDPEGTLTWPEEQNSRAVMLDNLISNYVTKDSHDEYEELSAGLFEVIPHSVFESGIKIMELHEKFFGASTVDLDDMFRNWDVSSFIGGDTNHQIVMLKAVLRSWSGNQPLLRKFVEFVTGSSRVIAGGFGAYRAATNYRFTVIPITRVDAWPKSHNCFNQLDLPVYTRQDIMQEKIREAILNSDAFGIV